MLLTMKSSKGGNSKNEIYVDIIEKITVLFNANGYIVNSSIDGSIQMKSFLSGNPELRLALNEDLVIGKGSGAYGSVILDDCNFHECVHLDEFESSRTLHFIPPDGEFAVLKALVQHPREPLTRDKLMNLARGREWGAMERSIDVQVSRLRRLIEDNPARARYIQTVWGVGYVFVPDGAE